MRPLTVKKLGGVEQLAVVDEQDLARVEAVDAARWAATSAPVKSLQCDPALLQFLDPDKSGRIRVSQLVAARDWLFARLGNRSRLRERADTLLLADLADTDDARALKKAAERVAAELNLPVRDRLSLGDVRAFRARYVKLLANGDGVVPPELVQEKEVADFARDLIGVVGGAPDASGFSGAGRAQLEKFLDRGQAFLAWQQRPALDPAVVPFGDDTATAAEAVEALEAKVDEYFLLCDLARQDAQAAQLSRLSAEEWRAFAASKSTALVARLNDAPLAPPTADAALPLEGALNPVWREKVELLATKVLYRALHPEVKALTRDDWRKVKSTLAPYRAWKQARPAEPFEKLPAGTLDAYLRKSALAEKLTSLIDADQAAAPELARVAELEKLVLLQRWLLELANNFVNFSAVYHPEQNAMVEMGSLVIDGRRLDFCVRVDDRASHKKVAAESLLFLVYVALTDSDGKAPAWEIAAPVTSGERGRLRVGKRGLFIDLAGKEWDAVIVDVVENPISLAEAVRAPFRRASSFVAKKIEELAANKLDASEKSAHGELGASVTKSAQVAEGVTDAAAKLPAPATPAPAAKPDGGGLNMTTLLMGGGIALAAVGSALAYVVAALASIKPLNGFLAVVGIVIVVGGLSGFLGWLKLRRRDMGLLFEAAGWAVNVEVKITRGVGAIFTRRPAFPEGAHHDRADLVDELNPPPKRSKLLWGAVLAVVLGIGVAGFVFRERLAAFVHATPPAPAVAAPPPAPAPAAK